MSSQLNLPHATKQKTNNEETKNKKNGDAQKKWSGREGHRFTLQTIQGCVRNGARQKVS